MIIIIDSNEYTEKQTEQIKAWIQEAYEAGMREEAASRETIKYVPTYIPPYNTPTYTWPNTHFTVC